MKRSYKPLFTILLIAYILIMLWLLLIQRMGPSVSGNYAEQLKSMPIPFQTVAMFLRIIITGEPADVVPHAWQNLIGNIVMFVPIGWFLPYFCKRARTWQSVLCIGLLIITCVELTQFLTLLGSLDFDDFMLNSMGVLLGFGIWKKIGRQIT